MQVSYSPQRKKIDQGRTSAPAYTSRLASILMNICAVSLLLSGCADDSATRIATAEVAAAKAQAQAAKAEEEKSTWQTVAMVTSVGAVLLLLIGTALGSSARKDAEDTNKHE